MISDPIEILRRELNRLENDRDRLQMLITLKSRLNQLNFTVDELDEFLSIFQTDEIRCRARNLFEIRRETPMKSSSNVFSTSDGVFEKAKQFVCRVFANVTTKCSSIDESTNSKRIHQENESIESKSDLSVSAAAAATATQFDQLHSILDNIDSVLDKIEAQAQSATHNENIDQDTQTNFDIVEHNRVTTSDGSGDQNSPFIDLLN